MISHWCLGRCTTNIFWVKTVIVSQMNYILIGKWLCSLQTNLTTAPTAEIFWVTIFLSCKHTKMGKKYFNYKVVEHREFSKSTDHSFSLVRLLYFFLQYLKLGSLGLNWKSVFSALLPALAQNWKSVWNPEKLKIKKHCRSLGFRNWDGTDDIIYMLAM